MVLHSVRLFPYLQVLNDAEKDQEGQTRGQILKEKAQYCLHTHLHSFFCKKENEDF